jgi:hypothetical protein
MVTTMDLDQNDPTEVVALPGDVAVEGAVVVVVVAVAAAAALTAATMTTIVLLTTVCKYLCKVVQVSIIASMPVGGKTTHIKMVLRVGHLHHIQTSRATHRRVIVKVTEEVMKVRFNAQTHTYIPPI